MLDRSRRRRLQTAGEIALLAAIASRREDPSRDPREVERLCPNRLGQALAFETADASIFERVASGRSIDAWQRGASAMAFAPKIAAKPAMAIQISKTPRARLFLSLLNADRSELSISLSGEQRVCTVSSKL